MAGQVLVDEWTLVLVADASLSSAGCDGLREAVAEELARTATRLTSRLAPTGSVVVSPR
jgi:hypothetical protein